MPNPTRYSQPPRCGVEVGQGRDVKCCCGVNKHVATAEPIQYLGRGATRRCLVTEVGRDLGGAINHHDAVAAGFQGGHDRPTDRPGTARNDGDPSRILTLRTGVHGFSTTLAAVAAAEPLRRGRRIPDGACSASRVKEVRRDRTVRVSAVALVTMSHKLAYLRYYNKLSVLFGAWPAMITSFARATASAHGGRRLF